MKTSALLFALLLVSFTSISQVNLNQGLIAYFPFNGNANDVSGGGNNGIIQGGAQLTTDRNGNLNSAFQFDGIDDYIRVPNAPPFNQSNAFSIAFYFLTSRNTLQTMVGKISYSQGIGTQYQVGMGFGSYPGVYFGLNPPTTGCSNQIAVNNNYVKTGSSTPSLNQWHCLVASFDAGVQKIYLDGVLKESATTPFATLNICSNSDMQIGSWWSGDVQFFQGKIDDVRFYNRALNQSEVNALCLSPCATAPVIDFGFNQDICSPKSVQFNSNVTSAQSYQWSFGNSQTNSTSLTPSVNYNTYGSYQVTLGVEYSPNCYTSIIKTIPIVNDFDNSIIQTADATICTGDSIQLITTSNLLNYCWSASNGVSNPVPASGYVKPSSSTTYYLNTQNTGSNLVINGNFSSGNSGFTSDYVSANPNTTEGQYWVSGNPPSWNPGLSSCTDHTSGSGNMMMVNGSPTAGAKIWSQSVVVSPNTNYAFSTWIQSLNSVNPANLKFSINNVTIGDNITAGTVCNWNRFSTTWNSGVNTTAVITIVNNNTVAQGNDFAIDDIFFGPIIVKNDSVRITVNPCVLAIPSFTIPDTVCVNQPVNINNTSTGASNYYWNFCVANLNQPPAATNIGNPGSLSSPVFIDYAFFNGNYYGFVVNYNPGGLVRLNFGNSLLNTPTSTYLGNFGGILPVGAGSEGIQIVFNEGKWYAIIVGGSIAAGNSPRILKIEFGANLNNPAPVATNWGNLGNMLQPIDLHVFKEGSNWYGLTVSAENNTITRFNFTNSFNNTPTATSLGNIGSLQYPTGIYAINDNGFWRVFVVNGGDNTRTSSSCSLTRLDFGSSLLNTPTGINLGNPGNKLQHPRDLTIMKQCGQIIGFAVNGNPNYNDLVKLDFNNNLSAAPSIVSLGNSGGLNFPHSISKLFRVDNDVYGFITNVASNTITRLKFSGCSNASIQNTSAANPPAVVYSVPGTYSINLTVDDLLPTQGAICKQVVVLPEFVHNPPQSIAFCEGDSIKIGRNSAVTSYQWNNGSLLDSIIVKSAGTYWVNMTRFGCANRDSFIVTVNAKPVVQTLSDTSICHGSSIVLNTQSSGASTFSWSPVTSLSNPNISSPAANPTVTTQYVVTAFSAQNCKVKDTINLTVSPTPTVNLGPDRSICKGDSLVLDAGNSGAGFLWQNAASTQTIFAKDSGFYYVTVTNGCFASDTMHLSFYPDPSINVMNDTAACMQTSFIISTQTSGNYIYSWSPVTGLSSATVANPVLTVSGTRRYYLTATNSFNCKAVDSVLVTKKDLPVVNLGKDTSICGGQSISLDAQNPGGVYLWSNGNSSQTISVNAPGTYSVNVTKNGCSNADTIVISRKTKVFNLVPAIAAVCYEDSLRLQASGGSLYEWFLNGVPTGLIDSTIKVWPRVPGIYSVKVTETQCGFTDTLYSTIFIKPAPVISVTKSNDISCANPRAQLKATGAFSYKWTPATFITNDAVASPYVYPVVNTWYHVKGKGIDGCTVEDSVQVLMDSAAFVKFYVPTAFTPNQDGKNDCLKVLYGGFVKDFEFVIYNRWGEIVFKTTDISKCWDGYTNGRKQPNDVYVYIMNGANDCGKVSKKGIVTLIY